jgi:hypothetical protein
MALKKKRQSNALCFPCLNNKAQAALTDALYFLLIVSTLSTFMFFFASSHGVTLQQRVVTQYWREYSTGALETILYSSTPRIPGQTLEQASEVDYLLAAVKEDFADDSEIDETKEVLAQNISGIMQPIAGNFDYMFYLYAFDSKEFAFVLIYSREEPTFQDPPPGEENLPGQGRKVIPGNARIHFCKPNELQDIDSMVETLGASAQSNARIQLVRIDEENEQSYPPAQANLTMWVPTPIDDRLAGLNCELYTTIPAN